MNKWLLIFLLVASPCWAGVDFDGVDDIMTASANAAITGSSASMYALVRVDALPVSGDSYIHALYTNDISGAKSGLELRLGLDGTDGGKDNFYCFGVEDDGGSRPRRAASSTLNISTGTWYSVFCYIDGSTTDIKVCDHSSGSCTTDTGDSWIVSTIDPADNTHFGYRSSARYWDGVVSEFALFNDVLTTGEMDLIFKGKVKRTACQLDNILLYYTFDSCSDGSACHGTVFRPPCNVSITLTGDDGANNTGMAGSAEEVLSYP